MDQSSGRVVSVDAVGPHGSIAWASRLTRAHPLQESSSSWPVDPAQANHDSGYGPAAYKVLAVEKFDTTEVHGGRGRLFVDPLPLCVAVHGRARNENHPARGLAERLERIE